MFSPSERFRNLMKNGTPGPGLYELPGMMSQKTGMQHVSFYHSVKVRRFGTAQRPDIGNGKQKTPGPGTYRPPSDFGYLDFKPKTEYSPVGVKTFRTIMT